MRSTVAEHPLSHYPADLVPWWICIAVIRRQPIKFCVNNNPSSNNGIADCGAIGLSDLPRVNSSFLSAECYARRAWITFCGQEIIFSGANQADILSSNIIDNWLKTTSQFRHLCVQRSTIFCDAKYNILRRLSSFVNDGLFFVICLNWRFKPSIIFVVYIILRTSGGYAKKVDRISQFSSQLLTQDG